MTDRLFYRADDLSTYKVLAPSTGLLPSRGLVKAMRRDGEQRIPATEPEANLVASKCADGQHMPVIDLDVPHRVVPSTTPGHGHLYIDVKVAWWRYVALLLALRLCGVIEKGFLWWSLKRGATFVRKPGVSKEPF